MRFPLLAACLLLSRAASACVAPEWLVPISLPSWDGGKLDVASTARAPFECPGPDHPILTVDSSSATAWVHVVETNMPAPDAKTSAWTFIDVSTTARASGIPFYSEGPNFWDNPRWTKPKTELVWRGTVFAVRVKGKSIKPIGAVRWGFRWKDGDVRPAPLPIQRASRADWDRRLKQLKREFPDWEWR